MTRKLSYSQMSMFEECPRKWYTAYVKKIREPTPKAFLLGRIVHSALQETASLMDVNAGLKTLDNVKQFSYAHSATAEQELAYNLVKAGWKTLNRLGVGNIPFSPPLTVHAEQHLTYRGREFDFTGFIDLAFWKFPEQPVLVDWKTTSTAYSEHDIVTSSQLTAYAWLWWKLKGVVPAYIAYITLDKKSGHAIIYEGKRSEVDLKLYEERIASAAKGMDALVSWRNERACTNQWGTCYYYNQCWDSRKALLAPKTDF